MIYILFFKNIIVGFAIIVGLAQPASEDANITLSDEKIERANTIAELCIENWNEYGCLPSVCIAQAILESSLGDICYPYNYWGLYGGYHSFDSLEDGVYGYMQFINDYYPNAPFVTNPYEQIQIIYNGGYCQGNTQYVENIKWIIENYNLTYYDNLLFAQLKSDEYCHDLKEKIQNYIDILREYGYIITILDAIH